MLIRRLIILLLIVGCAAIKKRTTFTTAAIFYIGMTEEEFIIKNPSITKKNDWQRWEKVINSPVLTTYIEYETKTTFIVHKVNEDGNTYGAAIPNPKQEYIFAFKNDTLFAVYHGELNDDLKREIDYSNYPNSKPE